MTEPDSPRPACSDAERRASRTVARELRRRHRRTRIDAVWVRPQWPWVWLVVALVAVGGSVAATAAPEVALAVLGVVAAAALVELGSGLPAVSWPWPRRATQNVWSPAPGLEPADRGAPPAADGRVRVVLAVAADTPRATPAGLLFRLGAGTPGVVASSLVVLTACAGARVGGVEATWLGAVQLLPTVACLLAAASLLELALAKPDPGAPSAVAAALDALAQLDARPPRRVDVDLLLVGAADARAVALPRVARGAALVWLEPGGPDEDGAAEALAWPRAGVRRAHPDLVAAAEEAGYAPASGPAPLAAARTRGAVIAVSGGDPAALVRGLDRRV